MDSRYLPAILAAVSAALPLSARAASWQERAHTMRAAESRAPGDTLTFATALARVFARNPALPAGVLGSDAARANTGQAGAWPNPSLALEAENVGGSYAGLDYAEMSLVLTQDFELGGRRGARVAAAEEAARSARFEARTDTLDLFIATRRRYADLVHAETAHRIAGRTADVVADLVEAADGRVTAGAALVADRALASAALARARLETATTDSARRRARVALASLWGEPGFAEPVAAIITVPASAPSADSAAVWAQRSPGMIRARLAAGALRADHAVEKALRVPPLSASLGVRRVQFDDAGTFLFGLSMPLPLWDRRADAVRAADARARAADLAEARVRAEVTGELAARIESLAQLLAQVGEIESTVIPELQSAAEGLRAAYQMGSASYPDLLEVQRTLAAVEREQNDARRAIVEEVIAIEAITGTPIQELNR